MAYINADEVKAIRNELKARFPKFKFGVRKGSGSLSVCVTVKSGPIDFISDYLVTVNEATRGGVTVDGDYLQINQYWYEMHFTGEAKDTITEILKVIKTAPKNKWYDNSDIQSDYFDTAFYINLSIGDWDKPYIVS